MGVVVQLDLVRRVEMFNGDIDRELADPGGCAVYGVVSRSLDCWDGEFESR